mgnify:CR=1 FL=1
MIKKRHMDPIATTEAESWYRIPSEQVIDRLNSSALKGLGTGEAESRLEQVGLNEISREEEISRWAIWTHQFKDPLIYILLVAAFITLILQDYIDSGVIAIVVLFNAVIGYLQESKARQAILALSKLSAPKASVVRDGQVRQIEASLLVPGDIVMLTSGDRVAADMRIITHKTLEVNESSLTGESMVVRKSGEPLEMENPVPGDQTNMLFAGTIITQGRAKAIVVRTGKTTELGKIAASVRRLGLTRTPLQEKVMRMGNVIGLIIAVVSVLIAVIGVIHEMSPYEVFITVVAIAVSAIPEGLPVVLTITLAIGMRRMAKRQAIIRSLPAVETLGSTSVIGSDKTGTLTKNEMTVRQIWADQILYQTTETGYGLDGSVHMNGGALKPEKKSGLYATLLAGTIANEAPVHPVLLGDPKGDPTEIALHVSAIKGELNVSHLGDEMMELDILPFEPERQFMATLNQSPTGGQIFLKGAPEVIIDRCSRMMVNGAIIPIDKSEIREAAAAMAGEGLRVLAMAYKETMPGNRSIESADTDSGFIFAGLQGMEDPVRPEAVEAIRVTREAGIRVIMITGDHVQTALAIGKKLGLVEGESAAALQGTDLDKINDLELDELLERVSIFARVSPHHKLRIVERLKEKGHIVAVTGDGVNDAPALRAAHLGIAMGKSGTDVAREASDMVLSDDNFATITAAVEEGRIVFSNIRKVTFFLLSTAVGEMVIILVAVALNWPLPFIAVQILWINVVTSGLQDVALAFEPGEKGIIGRKPRDANEGILSGRLLERLAGVGLLLAAGTSWTFWWAMETTGGDLDAARSVALTQMVVFQNFHVFNCRSLDRSIFTISPFSNKYLYLSVAAALLFHIAVLHIGWLQTLFRTVPLTLDQWMVVISVGVLVVIGGELDKILNRWRKHYIG